MSQTTQAPPEGFSIVHTNEGVSFLIAYGDCTVSLDHQGEDPIALAYKNGDMQHMADVTALAKQRIGPEDKVLDLGAHLGGFAMFAGALGCEVIALEASPRNAALVRKSVEANEFDNVTVVHAAVSDQPGELEFSAYGPYGHIASTATNLPTVRVRALTVDELLAEHGWDSVKFIKMDVEGSEISALRGMSKLLNSDSAPTILLESNSHTLGFYDKTPADLLAELKSFGYKVYTRGENNSLTEVDENVKQVETIMDYLAEKPKASSM